MRSRASLSLPRPCHHTGDIGSPTTNLLGWIGRYAEIATPLVGISGHVTNNLFRAAGGVKPYIAIGLTAIDVGTIAKDPLWGCLA
jgi:hypothetical protein